MAKLENSKTFAVGALVGGVLGAVTALLFAPKSGKELRADLADQYQNVSDKTQELARSVGTSTSEWVDRAKEKGSAVIGEVKSWSFRRNESEDSRQELAQVSEISLEEEAEIVRQG
ncbi:YtxH domain-containing protein [Paenibacillus aurantius]|uniref:YtxH domain-containing protein n=1 Tax=Paenibacillus aurantius TaxID=2918900 RepID=A0AA96LCR3_9BACL|nr:YtxH domain-containing protein [Paenibacillus aurantius]WJH34597.1 YtxH domain-containing protein [Paenibacillus sp. CC-CFT747]WNQ09815.1 YtxH domain-containing protein [Paenibacillus aurantius]